LYYPLTNYFFKSIARLPLALLGRIELKSRLAGGISLFLQSVPTFDFIALLCFAFTAYLDPDISSFTAYLDPDISWVTPVLRFMI